MLNNTRKIVVLNNLKSQRIEQAIFILRDEKDYSEADAVIEAERIVDSYLENMRRPLLEKSTKKDNKNKPDRKTKGSVGFVNLFYSIRLLYYLIY